MKILMNGGVTSATGFMAATAVAAIKYKNRDDLALVVSEKICNGAAMFTQNQVAAAPVLVDKAVMVENKGRLRAVLINAGNANACTGYIGQENARQTQEQAAAALHCDRDQILVMSTGVIGVQLPMDKMEAGIAAAVPCLSSANGNAAAQAIMTTDTVPKESAVSLQIGDETIRIGGMAKGVGMIHPNMATMLSLITTDADIVPELLEWYLRTAVSRSFNRISIDGDSSTNDTVLLLANGASGVTVGAGDARFQEGLTAVCTTLAHKIVRDGEGATKFVEIHVSGTTDDEPAHTIANSIATSPLVKTAFAGSDANWGRIMMAAGRAGVLFDQHQTALWIGGESADELCLVADGTPTAYAEADAAAIFTQSDFKIHLIIGAGNGRSTVWTSDLTHEYVSINADYRS